MAAGGQQGWPLVQRQPELKFALLAREVEKRPASVPRSTMAERAPMSAREWGKLNSVRFLEGQITNFIPHST